MRCLLILALLFVTTLPAVSRYIEPQVLPQHLTSLELTCKNGFKKRLQRSCRIPNCMPKTTGDSTNWCGYISALHLHHQHRNTVEGVWGSWIAPVVIPPVIFPEGFTSVDIWVGMDGFFNDSTTVEQIGTEHDWNHGAPLHFAWYEMFPLQYLTFVNFPVAAGDSISARVIYKGHGRFHMAIKNHTQKVHTSLVTRMPSNLQKPHRSSAEWIVEKANLRLANFRVITFTDCKAKISGHKGSISNYHWHKESLILEPINRVRARPSKLADKGQKFSVTWMAE